MRWTSLFLVGLMAGFPEGAGAAMAAPAPEAAQAGERVAANAAQMFAIVDQLLAAGNASQADKVLDALSGDPDPDIRNEARFRRARLAQREGRQARAATLLREVVDERPAAVPARLELAFALDKLDRPGAALRELRAAQALGLPATVAALVDRYSMAIRARRPFGASLEVAFAPSSNINRATSSGSLDTIIGDFEINDEAKAKSGVGLALHGQAYRRVAIADGASLLLHSDVAANLYRQSDFNDVSLDVSAGPEFGIGRGRVTVEAGVGQRWFGQRPFLRTARASATFSHPLGARMQVRLEASAAKVDHRINNLQDGKTFSTTLSVERALSATTGAIVTLGGERQSLRDPGYSTTGWRAGLTLWRDLGRMTLAASAEAGALHADRRLMLFPESRADRSLRLALSATIRRFEAFGFAPVVRVSTERNRSNIAFYDYRRTSVEVGVARAF